MFPALAPFDVSLRPHARSRESLRASEAPSQAVPSRRPRAEAQGRYVLDMMLVRGYQMGDCSHDQEVAHAAIARTVLGWIRAVRG
jgi:hypothetical protein